MRCWGVGDIDFREKSIRTMKEKINSDKTVVLVSHSAETIQDTCDRLIWIENGEVREEGEVTNVLHKYGQYKKTRER